MWGPGPPTRGEVCPRGRDIQEAASEPPCSGREKEGSRGAVGGAGEAQLGGRGPEGRWRRGGFRELKSQPARGQEGRVSRLPVEGSGRRGNKTTGSETLCRVTWPFTKNSVFRKK